MAEFSRNHAAVGRAKRGPSGVKMEKERDGQMYALNLGVINCFYTSSGSDDKGLTGDFSRRTGQSRPA